MSDQRHGARASFSRDEVLVPKELAIETVFGCNLSCPMCSIDEPTTRKKLVMSMDRFRWIVDGLTPHVNQVDRVDLFGLGEPLLDKHLYDRIRYLKERKFRNLAISTNADILDAPRRRALLESKIDTVIFSIDGTTKESQETIRLGSKLERVVDNVEETIRMRDEGDFPTRFVIRFIRQALNETEWPEYKEYWSARVSRERRDLVVAYNMHNNGGLVGSKEDMLHGMRIDPAIEARACHFLFDCLIVLADGQVAACHPDFHQPHFDLGAIPPLMPMQAFNSEAFRELRVKHASGRKNEIPLCSRCTIPYCEVSREVVWEVPEKEPAF